ncbi:MAG: hypothetical protein DPW11_02890 [bacterium]|nr:hypothetical protein [bacterium]
MQIIKSFITTHALKWSDKEKQDQNSIAGFIIRHIESHDKLRDAQIEAIKVYLWLKSIGGNKPLVELFSKLYPDKEGDALTTLLYDLAVEIDNKKLIMYVKESREEEIRDFFIKLFGGYKQVSNILFSLPMGSGKTFVMASNIK